MFISEAMEPVSGASQGTQPPRLADAYLMTGIVLPKGFTSALTGALTPGIMTTWQSRTEQK